MPKQANHLRLKKPCANCPFRKEGAIELVPGRLEGIINDIVENDMTTFHCHKTVHSKSGGEWDEEGNYAPSGQESMCACCGLLDENRQADSGYANCLCVW